MHDVDLIFTLAWGLGIALVFGFLTQKVGLSPIVGYLIAGVCVGPSTPGVEVNKEMANQLAELGVVLLMFDVGLQFHIKEMLAVWKTVVPGSILHIFAAVFMGAVAVHALGWGWTEGIVFGLAISVASTVVLLRVLADHHELHTSTGHITIAWSVVQDLFTVFVLVLMPLFLRESGSSLAWVTAIGIATLKITALILLVFLIGGRVVPWLFHRIALTGSRELFTLTVLAVALGMATGSSSLFGVSMPLGAFLAGMVVGRSDFSLRAASEALSMRNAFAVLFFVSVGMLFNWRIWIEAPGLVFTSLAVIVIGKAVVGVIMLLLLRYPLRTALSVAVALSQIGEFSFILATQSRQLNLLSETASNVLVAAAIVSITLNPFLFSLTGPLEKWLTKYPWVSRWLTSFVAHGHGIDNEPPPKMEHSALVVGYGPVGQTVCTLLRANRIEPIIIELNVETVHRLKAAGMTAIYGDVGHAETLRHAGIQDAEALVLSTSGIQSVREVIRIARELNPEIRILVHTTYVRESPHLLALGVDHVFSGEGEVALSMTTYLLQHLGATPEQIDRERTRVGETVYGTLPMQINESSHSSHPHR